MLGTNALGAVALADVSVPTTAPGLPFEPKWAEWTTPVWRKRSLQVGLHQSLAYVGAATQNIDPNHTGNFLEQVTYSRWAFQWSEPVRPKVGLKAHLQTDYTNDTIDPLRYGFRLGFNWWSEPVRTKPGLRPELQQSFTADTLVLPISRDEWLGFNWWSEPVRLPRGIQQHLPQAFFTTNFIVGPGAFLDAVQKPYSDPIWPKRGLGAWLQQFLAYHPRYLPPPDITATMAATETNNDVALIALNVYSSVTPATGAQIANVSIVEIPAIAGGAVSIEVP